ncbi:hypothetical protein [Lactiplantibacillus plantarum]|nr:hypothetical protein [Lactiplantibacillus plantarum]
MEATTTAATATHKMSTMDYVYKVSAGVSNAILVPRFKIEVQHLLY